MDLQWIFKNEDHGGQSTHVYTTFGIHQEMLNDKRDDFDFHIVNFLYLSSNIPSGPSYGVYISQLIRYA